MPWELCVTWKLASFIGTRFVSFVNIKLVHMELNNVFNTLDALTYTEKKVNEYMKRFEKWYAICGMLRWTERSRA